MQYFYCKLLCYTVFKELHCKGCNFEVICNPHVAEMLACKDLRRHAHERCEALACKMVQIHDDARSQVAELDAHLHALKSDAL